MKWIVSVFTETVSTPLRIGLWLVRLGLLLLASLYLLIGAGIHSHAGIFQGILFLLFALMVTVVMRIVDRVTMWARVQRVRRWL